MAQERYVRYLSNQRRAVKFWLFVLGYAAVTAAAVYCAMHWENDLPDDIRDGALLPPWAVTLAMMLIILTGLIADRDDDFRLFWVDLTLLILYGLCNLAHHAYLYHYWSSARSAAEAAILTVWPWGFVVLFVLIGLVSVVRRPQPELTPQLPS